MNNSPPTAKANELLARSSRARATQVASRQAGSTAEKPRRAVLFGYLLRSAAQNPNSALSERAALIVDRLELHALESLIPLLTLEELCLMAALAFAPHRAARMRELSPRAMASLLQAADFELATDFLRTLELVHRKAILAMLGERRRPLEVALGLAKTSASDRGARVLDALRLRRLFSR